jgi:hypothetical protein
MGYRQDNENGNEQPNEHAQLVGYPGPSQLGEVPRYVLVAFGLLDSL